jgi:hypothetical protein
MSEKNKTQLTTISKARTLEEIAEFWDTHSLADYRDKPPQLNSRFERNVDGVLRSIQMFMSGSKHKHECVVCCQRRWLICGWLIAWQWKPPDETYQLITFGTQSWNNQSW